MPTVVAWSVEDFNMPALTIEAIVLIYLGVFLNQVAAFLDNIFPFHRKLLVSAHNIKFFRELFEVLNDVAGVDEPDISRPIAKALQHP